jgi:hypothetical protein
VPFANPFSPTIRWSPGRKCNIFSTLVSPLRNIALGLGAAIVIAFVLVVPRIGTVATWKVVLAAAGLAVYILAGRDTSKR